MKKAIIALAILVVIVIGILATGGSIYNSLVDREQAVDAAWANVANQYQRRADLVPNLVSTVKGSANFEQEVLENVVEARASVGRINLNVSGAPEDLAQLERFQQAQGAFGGALQRLLAVAENYPDLKASASFRDLQAQLEGTENRIAVERGRFNEAAQAYNARIKRMPAVFFAGMLGFDPKPYFEAETGTEEPPAVEFNFGAEEP